MVDSKRGEIFKNIKVEDVTKNQDNPNERINLRDDNYLVSGGNNSDSHIRVTLIEMNVKNVIPMFG